MQFMLGWLFLTWWRNEERNTRTFDHLWTKFSENNLLTWKRLLFHEFPLVSFSHIGQDVLVIVLLARRGLEVDAEVSRLGLFRAVRFDLATFLQTLASPDLLHRANKITRNETICTFTFTHSHPSIHPRSHPHSFTSTIWFNVHVDRPSPSAHQIVDCITPKLVTFACKCYRCSSCELTLSQWMWMWLCMYKWMCVDVLWDVGMWMWVCFWDVDVFVGCGCVCDDFMTRDSVHVTKMSQDNGSWWWFCDVFSKCNNIFWGNVTTMWLCHRYATITWQYRDRSILNLYMYNRNIFTQ